MSSKYCTNIAVEILVKQVLNQFRIAGTLRNANIHVFFHFTGVNTNNAAPLAKNATIHIKMTETFS